MCKSHAKKAVNERPLYLIEGDFVEELIGNQDILCLEFIESIANSYAKLHQHIPHLYDHLLDLAWDKKLVPVNLDDLQEQLDASEDGDNDEEIFPKDGVSES